MSLLNEAKRVVLDEAKALQILSESLGQSFIDAVDCILSSKGRVAVTGMGKSGIIGRKISATLASTGTPSFFIHPSEASHGDLGMLSKDDVLLAISNSGKTAELTDIVIYAIENSIPVICITQNGGSFLGKHSDYVLLQPKLHEACPLNCAPTTSTTVQLALGDALAMCLLEARGFSKEDFKKFHPGGSLGNRLTAVKEIMHTGAELPKVNMYATTLEILKEMTNKGFGCVLVEDNELNLVGIISDGDLRRSISPEIMKKKAYDLMTNKPKVIEESSLTSKALAIMKEAKISCLVVVEGQKSIGLVTLQDVVK